MYVCYRTRKGCFLFLSVLEPLMKQTVLLMVFIGLFTSNPPLNHLYTKSCSILSLLDFACFWNKSIFSSSLYFKALSLDLTDIWLYSSINILLSLDYNLFWRQVLFLLTYEPVLWCKVFLKAYKMFIFNFKYWIKNIQFLNILSTYFLNFKLAFLLKNNVGLFMSIVATLMPCVAVRGQFLGVSSEDWTQIHCP